MIPIPADIARRVEFVVGSPDTIGRHPKRIFAPRHVAFLGALSQAILGDVQARALPDVTTFGFWCRVANLRRLAAAHTDAARQRIGLGMTFHISPGNVPVNFAYTLAFGLLAGNTCVVRLPSTTSSTADYLTAALHTLLSRDEWHDLRETLALIRYGHDDSVTAFWSSVSDGRVIWGGDETVKNIRRHPLPPRAREIAFSDRYSLCLLDAAAVLGTSTNALQALCESLYRDIYINDQAACSSPQLIVWLGASETARSAQRRMWQAMRELAAAKYSPEPVQVVEKYTRLCNMIMDDPGISEIDAGSNFLYRIGRVKLAPDQSHIRAHFGTMQEIVLDSFAPLRSIVDTSVQTITYFGLNPSELAAEVFESGLRGVDRIVPVGRALDIGLTWDGYDIVGTLSRIIHME